MIYVRPKQTLILTPPKTASTSLHAALCSRRGYYYILSLAQWGHVTKHCSLNELGFDGPELRCGKTGRRVLVVRHPTTRILSLYRHHLAHGIFEGPFRKWVERQDQSGGGTMWLRSCHSHLCGAMPDDVIRVESLNADLQRLGIPPISTRLNVNSITENADHGFAEEVARRWWPEDWQYYPGDLAETILPGQECPEDSGASW